MRLSQEVETFSRSGRATRAVQISSTVNSMSKKKNRIEWELFGEFPRFTYFTNTMLPLRERNIDAQINPVGNMKLNYFKFLYYILVYLDIFTL